MMGQIVVLISVGAFGVVMGMLLTAICVASGNAELEAEYQRHIDRLVKLLKASNEELDRWRRDAFEAQPDPFEDVGGNDSGLLGRVVVSMADDISVTISEDEDAALVRAWYKGLCYD